MAVVEEVQMMPEERFARVFVRRERRDRLLCELTNPKKRYRGLDRFCHTAGELLNPAKVLASSADATWEQDLAAFTRAHAKTAGTILSPDAEIDGLALAFADAVAVTAASSDAAIVVGGAEGDAFAYVQAEAYLGPRDRWLLAERKS